MSITAKVSGYGRPSKRSVGTYPGYNPPPAIGNGIPVIRVSRCPKNFSRVAWAHGERPEYLGEHHAQV